MFCVCSLNGSFKLHGNASSFLIGSDANDPEFLQVYNPDGKVYQLVANKNGFYFWGLEDGPLTKVWEAALKSDLGSGIGEYKIAIAGVNDLDNPPGAFILQTATNPKGYPTGLSGNACTVFQQKGTSNYTAQLAFNFASDKMAIRRKAGSTTWTDWKYFTVS